MADGDIDNILISVTHPNLCKDIRNKINPRILPIIATLYDTNISEYDLKHYIERGLSIIRFRLTKHTIEDKIKLIENLKRAVDCCCKKYEISDWPVAVSVDLANGSIFTGFLSEELPDNSVYLETDSIIELTSDLKYYFKCDASRIFINDPYTLPTIPTGTDIFLDFGKVKMVCVEVVNDKTLRCKVTLGGVIRSQEKVCVRGVKHLKPPLSKRDLDDIEFAKTHQCNILTINTVRRPSLIGKIRALFKDSQVPLILSVICDQEGLDNVSEIIAASDGLILAREYLACSLKKTDQLLKIQLQVGALCKMEEKPFFVSGHILKQSILNNRIIKSDLSDVTIAIEQGAGLFLRSYPDASHLTTVFKFIKDICIDVDSTLMKKQQFWDMPCKIPVNAAVACIYSSVLTAKLLDAKVIIVPTVTGKTVRLLSNICENIFILAVTKCPVIARQLQLYRGIIAIVYDDAADAIWKSETDSRIKFGAAFAMKSKVLEYNRPFVALKKATSYSYYCDQVCVWTFTDAEHTRLQHKIKTPIYIH